MLDELRALGRADQVAAIGRMSVLHLRELLSVIATFGPAAATTINQVRDILAPFYPR